jgi:hypothetical protein
MAPSSKPDDAGRVHLHSFLASAAGRSEAGDPDSESGLERGRSPLLSECARLGRSNVRSAAARVFPNVLEYARLSATGDGRTPGAVSGSAMPIAVGVVVQNYTRSKPGRPGQTRSNPVKNRVSTTCRPALDRVVESGFSNCFGMSSKPALPEFSHARMGFVELEQLFLEPAREPPKWGQRAGPCRGAQNAHPRPTLHPHRAPRRPVRFSFGFLISDFGFIYCHIASIFARRRAVV